MMLSDVCLSVAFIGPKSTTKRPRKTKIGTEVVAHVTRDWDTTFKVKGQRARSPGRFGWLYWQANMDIELVTDACMTYIMSPLAGLGGGISGGLPPTACLDSVSVLETFFGFCLVFKDFFFTYGFSYTIIFSSSLVLVFSLHF